MANFWVTSQCSGAAARRVAQDEIILRFQLKGCNICQLEIDIPPAPQHALHCPEAPLTDITGGNPSIWIAFRKNRSLATGCSASIEDLLTVPCNLRNQLRAFILNPHPAVTKGSS